MPSPFDDIFGGSGPQWTWEQMQARLDAAIARERLPRDLVYALVKQESNWDPHAEGDGGRAKGFFQLHPGAATDAGIDPAYRDDIGLNIDAGTRYLRLKLDQARGNEDQALRLYNGGGDPNYVANVRRHLSPRQGQPTLMPRAASVLSPTSAEAATPQQPPSGAVWDDIFGAEQAPATTPSPPTARSTPAEDAAYRQWAAQQATGATTTPTPVPQAAPTPAAAGGPPGGTQAPSAADAQYAAQTLAQMRQRQTPRTPVTDPAALLAVGGGPATPQPAPAPVTDPAALLAVGGGQAPVPQTREQQLLDAARTRQQEQGTPAEPQTAYGPPPEPPLEEGFTKPSTLIPLLMGGAGVKAVTRTLGEVPAVVSRIARPVVEGLSQTLGWGTGKTIEEGHVPSASELATEAGMNIAVGGAFEAIHAGVQQRLRRSQAGRAIVAADEQTRAAHQEWQTAVQEANAAQQAGLQEAYQTAERKALDAQARYQQRVQARATTIRANQQTYDEALTQYQQEVQTARRQAHQARTREIAQEQATYAGQVARQTADVQAQGQAIQTARAVPGRYSPETPSWVLYEKFGDVAKHEVIDLSPAKAGLAEVRASRGVLPDGTARPFPAAVEQIASTLEKAEGSASVQTIREELRRLGPLTRSPNGEIRGPAKQLYGLYADALEASPVANDLLRQANTTFRREMALQDVSEWLKPGHGIVRIDQQGRETINVGALLTRLEKQVGDDTLFARSFTPDDLQALQQDFGRLAGTPRMPTSPPRAPQPELLPGSAAEVPAQLREAPQPPGVPAEVSRPRPEQLPGGAGPGRRTPALPQAPAAVTPRQALGERPAFVGPRAGTWGAILATMTAMGVPAPITATTAAIGALHVTQKQGRWLLAHYLLDPKKRPLVQAALDSQMRLNPRTYGVMVHLLSPEEKKQYAREMR